ncbi:apolipoprotein N-acyltransferase [Ectothiorhodospira variabilis]|uniref:apolipoprotein N-acyltransferase n=1 Tax=Ectothiorhodospira variabilis TaxID=505694 RepID=UPI001EFBC93F|nr:apolipoprotein N-acyltransferase [Ectothiorhodospira variabilis]MCG5495716.1 apolipoprotein N-acyltransferase [Ectothiorhodospira variabilis]MCG5498652.1 apolipoprotein N-acyltransferase [Ectothiorhodospira variabilis]MCG5503268.1 apolipoprotein N-acyltransferase [Ectothiorhodospira variabilis]MCG5505973.1 apolipoprotein N-acyltransferase [Ectothiorhodospira variabilis]
MTASVSDLSLPRRIEQHPRLAALVAALAGVLQVLAFAPFEVRALSILAPAILFILWVGASPRQAAWRGYAFGVGLFGAGVYWVYHSLHLFGAAIAPLAALITAGFVLALALFPAFMGYLVARLRVRMPGPWALILLMPALWVLFEWWRGWFLTGFPWLLLGTAHLDTQLAGYVPVVGVFGVSALVAVMAGCLAWGLIRGQRAALWAGGVILALWLGGALLSQVEWTRPTGQPLTASLLQGNVAQEEKLLPEHLPQSMALYAQLTEEAFGSDLIVWPETAVPTFHRRLEPEFLGPLARAARAQGSTMITGIFTYDPETGNMYNSIARLDGAGEAEFYHKRKLVPFGEYLPLRGLLMWLDDFIELPMADLSRGHGGWTLEAAGVILGPSICYEDAFGSQIIRALPRAQLLVNVTNDAWFGDSIAPHQHLEIARARSLETGREMLRATNTGISAVIDHRGRIRDQSPQFETHVLTAHTQPRDGATPYVIWGNWPVVLWAVAMVVALPLLARRRTT